MNVCTRPRISMWNGMATIAKCECMCACARARYAREIRTLWQNVYPFLSLSLLTQSFILIVKLLLFLFVSPISADISQNRENWVKRSSRMNAQHQWMLWCYSDCYCFVCTNHKVRTEKSAQCKHTRTFVFSLFGMHRAHTHSERVQVDVMWKKKYLKIHVSDAIR